MSIYYGKILLFGEYSVLLGSMGLSIPYVHFRGELSFPNNDKYTDLDYAKKSNKELSKYVEYIEKQVIDGQMPVNIDVKRLKADISDGLFFDSTIPEGYGLGSSGALVASIYKKYANPSNPTFKEGTD